MREKTRRLIALAGSIVLLLSIAGGGAFAQVPFVEAEFRAFATGSTAQGFLVETLNDEDMRAFQVDLGFTGAAVDSEGLTEERRRSLDNMVVVPGDLEGTHSYARSSALEGGFGVTDGDVDESQYDYAPELVEAVAPPAERNEAGPATDDFAPLFYGEGLFAEAEADWRDDACVPFFSQARADVAHAELFDTDAGDGNGNGLEEPVVTVRVLESYSGTGLDAQLDAGGNPDPSTGAAAVYGEVRHRVVQVEFVDGSKLTLSASLRATASGTPGGAHVHYDANIAAKDPEGDGIDLFPDGDEPIVIPIGEDPQYLAHITVATQPEETTADDGTFARGEVTPVSIRILTDGEVTIAGLDVGSMEAEAEAPEGGIVCEVPMAKAVEPQTVAAGEEFTFTITVENPYDCVITAVVVDEISVQEGDPSWTVTGSDPEADETSDTRLVWEGVTIDPGETAEFTIFLRADDDSAAGVLRNDAWLEDAVCQGVPLHGDATVLAGMPVVGQAFVIGPGIGAPVVGVAVLPATGGGAAMVVLGLLLIGAALLLHRLRSGRAGTE
jgi:hypothetical protein